MTKDPVSGLPADFDWTDETLVNYLIWDDQGRDEDSARREHAQLEIIHADDDAYRQEAWTCHPEWDNPNLYRAPHKGEGGASSMLMWARGRAASIRDSLIEAVVENTGDLFDVIEDLSDLLEVFEWNIQVLVDRDAHVEWSDDSKRMHRFNRLRPWPAFENPPKQSIPVDRTSYKRLDTDVFSKGSVVEQERNGMPRTVLSWEVMTDESKKGYAIDWDACHDYDE